VFVFDVLRDIFIFVFVINFLITQFPFSKYMKVANKHTENWKHGHIYDIFIHNTYFPDFRVPNKHKKTKKTFYTA
jgi:hypothetical protein